VYLVQHAEAVPAEDNPDRPLSDNGRTDVQRVASFLARSVRVGRIVHSPKTRARDTAVLLAQALGPGGVVEEAASGLAPDDSVEVAADLIAGWSEDTMVVGHLPFMGRLAAYLVAGSEDADVVAFQPGTVVCLERADGEDAEDGEDGEGDWTVAWMMRPGLLGG
jgi:phosphohistidine phosphatase